MTRNQENTYYDQCMCTSVEYAFDSKVVKDKHPLECKERLSFIITIMIIRVQM